MSIETTMIFPETWEEFEKLYGFTDKEQFYTNGSRLIQCFRVKQWLDYLEAPKGEWFTDGDFINCSHCKKERWSRDEPIQYPSIEILVKGFRYCPNCGAKMKTN